MIRFGPKPTKRGRGQRRSRRLKNRASTIQWLRIDLRCEGARQVSDAFREMGEACDRVIQAFALTSRQLGIA